MTFEEIMKDICDEFPYYKAFRDQNKGVVEMAFRYVLQRNKNVFKNNANTEKWSIIQTTESDDDCDNRQRPFPCKSSRRYHCKTHKKSAPNTINKIPPHTGKCLVKRVLLSGPMTLEEIANDISREFPYYAELKNTVLHKIIGYSLYRRRHFTHNKKTKKWSLVSPNKRIKRRKKTTAKKQYPCREAPIDFNCNSAKPSIYVPKSNIKFPKHKMTCLLERALSRGTNMTLEEIVKDICEDFPYYAEFRRLRKNKLNHKFLQILTRNKNVFKLDKQNKTWSLLPAKKYKGTSKCSKEDNKINTVKQSSSEAVADNNRIDSQVPEVSSVFEKEKENRTNEPNLNEFVGEILEGFADFENDCGYSSGKYFYCFF